jgi:hypothetical protein
MDRSSCPKFDGKVFAEIHVGHPPPGTGPFQTDDGRVEELETHNVRVEQTPQDGPDYASVPHRDNATSGILGRVDKYLQGMLGSLLHVRVPNVRRRRLPGTQRARWGRQQRIDTKRGLGKVFACLGWNIETLRERGSRQPCPA